MGKITEKMILKEKKEHPWLSHSQARRIVQDHGRRQ